MASVNQTRPHCVNQMGKTHSKPLAARHGRGTAWARHAMCESAFSLLPDTVKRIGISGYLHLFFLCLGIVNKENFGFLSNSSLVGDRRIIWLMLEIFFKCDYF